MKQFLRRLWREDDGVLSFEWTVLTSLLTVGVVSGIAAVRDATIDEMGDLSQAMISLDQSYYVQPPLAVQVHSGYGGATFVGLGVGGFGYGLSGASDSGFVDAASYSDCYRGPHTKVQEFRRRSEPGLDRPAPEASEPAPAL